MIEDVKKKQSKYYDFGFESNLIQLSEHPFLQQKFKDLLPQIIEELEPQNVKQLAQLYIQQPNNNKLRTLTYSSFYQAAISLIGKKTTLYIGFAMSARKKYRKTRMSVKIAEDKIYLSNITAHYSFQIAQDLSLLFYSTQWPKD